MLSLSSNDDVIFFVSWFKFQYHNQISKNDRILIMTPEEQDKTLELSKHWSPDSTPARNEVIMKTRYPINQ